MVKVALFVRLEAKPGKEREVESFLMGGLPLVEDEPATHRMVRPAPGSDHVRHLRCASPMTPAARPISPARWPRH